MFKFSTLEVDNFFESLTWTCQTHFSAEPELEQQIKALALMSFSKMSKSDSLLFSLENTVKCATIALFVVQGQAIQTGHSDANAMRQILCATLFSRVGILRSLFPEDKDPTFLVSNGRTVDLPFTQTDSALWQHCAERSSIYVRATLADLPYLDIDSLVEAIKCADFTRTPSEINYSRLSNITRACQIIGLMSNLDPNRATLKMFLAAREGGVLEQFGLRTLDQFRSSYRKYFWENLFTDITDIISLLEETDKGFQTMVGIYQQV